MANTTSKVDGLDICTAIVNINGVAAASIKAVNVWDKKSCATCTTVELAYDRESCSNACRARCAEYYTDGDPDDGFVLGDKIYRDSSCTDCVDDGYYADTPCGGRNGCLTVRSCAITRIDACR
jgi:hypothetical protein